MLFRDFLNSGWRWKLSSENQVDKGRRKEPALHWARLENPQWSLRQHIPCLWERAGSGNTFTPSFFCGRYKCGILLHSQQMTLLWENSRGNGAFPPPLGFPSSSAHLHLPTCLRGRAPSLLLRDNYFTLSLKPTSCFLCFAAKLPVSDISSKHLSGYFFLSLQQRLSKFRSTDQLCYYLRTQKSTSWSSTRDLWMQKVFR